MLKQYRVRIAGWQNSRTVIEDNGRIALEIALSHNHCPTCSDRVRYVTRKLAERNIQYSWMYPGRAESFMVVDAPGSGLAATEYLSGLLDLRIS